MPQKHHPIVQAPVLITFLLISTISFADDRGVALLIGNAGYSEIEPLRNPINDIKLVGGKLSALGYKVILKEDLTAEEIKTAVSKLSHDKNTIFYFAGHGGGIDGRNWISGTDVSLGLDIKGSVDLELVTQTLDWSSPNSVVVIDACRDDNYGKGRRAFSKFTQPGGLLRNTTLVYSTSPRTKASDGKGGYSPFASSFAKYVGDRRTIDSIVKDITREVLDKTDQAQLVRITTSTTKEFCLAVCEKAKVQVSPEFSLVIGIASLTGAALLILGTRNWDRIRFRLAELIANGGAKVTSVVFFESSSEPENDEEWQYSTRFGAESARYIFWQFTLQREEVIEPDTIVVHSELWDVTRGEKCNTGQYSVSMRRSESKKTHYAGCGYKLPGVWKVGDYKLKIWVPGTDVLEANFRVVLL